MYRLGQVIKITEPEDGKRLQKPNVLCPQTLLQQLPSGLADLCTQLSALLGTEALDTIDCIVLETQSCLELLITKL